MAELKYYDKEGEEKSINLEIKFLTPKLRIELMKLDQASLKSMKAQQKKAKELMQELDIDLSNPANIDVAMLQAVDSDKVDFNLVEEFSLATWKNHDDNLLSIVRTIINYKKLNADDRMLIDDNDFINYVDIEGLKEIVNSFRSKYKL
jgi:hypothetical protein